MKKRIISFALALLITAGAFPAMSGAVSAKVDFDDLPTPIFSDKDTVNKFKRSKPELSAQADDYYYGGRLSWTPVDGALYYIVYGKEKGGEKYSKVASVMNEYCNVEYNNECSFRVRAVTYSYDDVMIGSDYSNTVTLKPGRIHRSYVTNEVDADYSDDDCYSDEAVYEEAAEAVEYAPAPSAGSVTFAAVNSPFEENTEEYSQAEESGYKNALTDPLSTFSADVDTASYANPRRLIKDSDNIPEDAVRIEEMLNYFDYNYAEPAGASPFSLTYELSDCPWNKDSKLMMIGVQGRDIPNEETPDSNLVFLVDVSGSMDTEDKLPLVVESINTLAETMSENDRISIVTYSGYESVILAGAKGNQKNTVRAMTSLLRAEGSTNGEGGIRAAYDIAERYFIEGGNNRIILASDGDLNVGIYNDNELKELVEEKRKGGVYLTTLGFGKGNLKDSKMEILADNGNGSYHYIDSAKEAYKVLSAERNSTLYTIAKDVKLQVEFNPENVKSYRLIGYDNRRLNNEDFENDAKDAGDVGAGHSVTVLYEIIPSDGKNNGSLKYSKPTGENKDEWCTLRVRYKKPGEEKSVMISAAIGSSAYSPADKMSGKMKFACAVAQFGLLLKDSEYKGTSSISGVKSLLSDVKENTRYSNDFKELTEMYENNYRGFPI